MLFLPKLHHVDIKRMAKCCTLFLIVKTLSQVFSLSISIFCASFIFTCGGMFYEQAKYSIIVLLYGIYINGKVLLMRFQLYLFVSQSLSKRCIYYAWTWIYILFFYILFLYLTYTQRTYKQQPAVPS